MHHFTVEEKQFLAEEIIGDHAYLEPSNFWNGQDQRTIYGMAIRYAIPRCTIRIWTKKIDCDKEEDEQMFHEAAGRPKDLDEIAIKEIKGMLYERRKQRRSIMKT